MVMSESDYYAPSAILAALYTNTDLSAHSSSQSARFSRVPASKQPAKGQNAASSSPVLRVADEASSKGYSTICVPLTTQKWRERWMYLCIQSGGCERDVDAERKAEEWRRSPSFLLDEVTMTSLEEAENVTIRVSEWLELDSSDEWIRHDSEIALHQELSYASYLSITHAILPPPRNRTHIVSYARTIASCLSSNPTMHFSVQLPPYDPSIFHSSANELLAAHSRTSVIANDLGSPRMPKVVVSISEDGGDGDGEKDGKEGKGKEDGERPSNDLDATWELWDVIRSVCDFNVRLSLALDLTLPLPSVLGSLAKWTAEPVRSIFLPASAFLANNKGYPVLPKVTQTFLRNSMTHRPTIILSGVAKGYHPKGGEAAYAQYVRHLEKTSPAVVASRQHGSVENYAMGYQDYLQAPLQPLMDHLQSATYQTFEQDPVKYASYEEAMFLAFSDWTEEKDRDRIVCVAGAGRGPLVARCLQALERSGKKASVYAVEKNPSAYVTLQNRKQKEWGDKVDLFFGDMRSIELPGKVDVLVSELLGSFGDNELSPECLDGAMRFLKEDGISIPSSYTSHIAPLSSSKLYNEARASRDEKHMETPYVVMFHAVNILSDEGQSVPGWKRCGGQIQECWEFEHPRREVLVDKRGLPLTNNHNVRSARLRFHIPHAGLLHGLAGYFEAVLYANIGLSIHPHRKDYVSKDMLSWFPIFFPFKDPLYLPSNSELQVSIWRRTNGNQVWYEWHAESFLAMPRAISNPDSSLPSNVPTSPTGTDPPPPPPFNVAGRGSGLFSSLSSSSSLLLSHNGMGSPSMATNQMSIPMPPTPTGSGLGISTSGFPTNPLASPLIDASDPLASPSSLRTFSLTGSGSPTKNRKSGASDGSGSGSVGMVGAPGTGATAFSDWSVVKIGQSGLHNPGGRSSWIGL